MEYRIQVTEKLQHIETVSAASGTEAVELVRQSYKEEKIVLSSEHFSDVAFAVEHQKAQAYYKSPNHDFVLAHGDCFELLWRKRSIPTHSEWLYPLTFDAGNGLKEA